MTTVVTDVKTPGNKQADISHIFLRLQRLNITSVCLLCRSCKPESEFDDETRATAALSPNPTHGRYRFVVIRSLCLKTEKHFE